MVCISPSQSELGHFFPPGKYHLSAGTKNGGKVPGTQYSFWCERDIRGTNGTKREKYREKYSGVNAAKVSLIFVKNFNPVTFLYYNRVEL